MSALFNVSGPGGANKLEDILNALDPNFEPKEASTGVAVMHNKAVQARTGNHEPTFYAGFLASPQLYHDPSFKPLPISNAIGLPILYRKDLANEGTAFTMSDPSLGFSGPQGIHQGERNEAFELLAVDVDPASSSYGKPTDTANCDVKLIRADGGPLKPEHVEALRAYVSRCQRFLFEKHLLSAEEIRKPGVESFSISPKAYFECFKKIQQIQVRSRRNLAWAIPFPGKGVKLERPLCDNCAVVESSSDKPMLKCGKCKIVHYCGRSCQQQDWSIHKKICKAK